MKNTNKKILGLLGVLLFLLFQASVSANTEADDKTLSPYFKVIDENNMGAESLLYREHLQKLRLLVLSLM